METLFIEARANQDALPVAKKLLVKLKKYRAIGLFTTVQHLDGLATIRNYFDVNGKKAVIGKPGSRCKYAGQTLGCDIGAAKSIENSVDAYVFLGTGRFHPLAVAVETNKPVFTVNPFLNHIEEIIAPEVRRFRNKRAANVAKVKAARNIGILATTKPGQNQLGAAIKLRKRLDEQGKNVFVFLGDTIDPSQMINFSKIDAWVNTCCPRMVEDVESFGRPVANIEDVV